CRPRWSSKQKTQNSALNLVMLGFPFETIIGADLNQHGVTPERARAEVMSRVLSFLLGTPSRPASSFGPVSALPQDRLTDAVLASLVGISTSLPAASSAAQSGLGIGAAELSPAGLSARLEPFADSATLLTLLDG